MLTGYTARFRSEPHFISFDGFDILCHYHYVNAIERKC